MSYIPINNTPEDKFMFNLECEAYDDNRWYDMVMSVNNRTMTKRTYKQLRHSLRECLYNIRNLRGGIVNLGKDMKVILTIVIIITCIVVLCLLWKPDRPLRTGTRSYYAKDRYLVANVHGEYLGECFVPSMDILQRLNQEQQNSIVLIETIPDLLR